MQAIILASGMGRGLGERYGSRPKPLLEFGGKSLLERQLDALQQLNVGRVVVTTGYLGDQIEQVVAGREDVITVNNERYDLGSMLSLHQGMTPIDDDDGLLVMNGDVLCDFKVLKRLVEEPGGNLLVLDREQPQNEDPFRVFVQQGKIVELRRRVHSRMNWTISGDCVGFFRFKSRGVRALRDVVKEYVMRGEADQSHEEVIRDLALADFNFFGIVDVTGIPWIEINNEADIQRAEQEVLPHIQS